MTWLNSNKENATSTIRTRNLKVVKLDEEVLSKLKGNTIMCSMGIEPGFKAKRVRFISIIYNKKYMLPKGFKHGSP